MRIAAVSESALLNVCSWRSFCFKRMPIGCEVLQMKSRLFVPLFLVALSMVSSLSTSAQQTDDALLSGFQTPPDSAKPRVWWHWMNGNISEEGIKLDLEWMHRVGIAGFQNFDAALQTPQAVDKRLAYMT